MKKFYLIFSLFLALTSCEKGDIDTMDNDVSNQKGIDKAEFYSKTMSFEDLKKEKGLTGELRSLQELNDYKKGKEDSLGFFLGFNNVKYVEKNGMHSYNFPIYKPEDLEGNLENLVLVSKPSGGYKVFMVQYGFTKNELFSLETEEISVLPVKVKKIKIEYASILSAIQNNLKAMQYSCNETWSMEYTCDQGMLCPNCECGRYDWVLIYKECSWYDDGTGTGGTTGGGTGSGGDGTGGGGSGSDGCEGKRFKDECNGDPEGIYSPTSPDMVEFYEKQFIKFLSSSPDLSSRDYYLNNLDNHRKDRIVSYLVNNKSSLESKEFGLEALKAWDAGGEVDFEEQIINNLTGKALNVYNKLKFSSTGFKNAIKKFEPDFPVAHLKFDMGDVGASRGRTIAPNTNQGTPISPNFVITVRLNNNGTDSGVDKRPALLVAKTIAHEVIHAEMYRKLLSVLDNGGAITGVTRQDILNALDGNFPGMYDYYRRHKNWQHQQMATHYRKTLARILQEFDTGNTVPDNQQPAQLYMDLSWEGLRYPNIHTWTSLPQIEKDRIDDVISNYITNN